MIEEQTNTNYELHSVVFLISGFALYWANHATRFGARIQHKSSALNNKPPASMRGVFGFYTVYPSGNTK